MTIRKLHDRLIVALTCLHRRQRKVAPWRVVCLDCRGSRKPGEPWKTRIV